MRTNPNFVKWAGPLLLACSVLMGGCAGASEPAKEEEGGGPAERRPETACLRTDGPCLLKLPVPGSDYEPIPSRTALMMGRLSAATYDDSMEAVQKEASRYGLVYLKSLTSLAGLFRVDVYSSGQGAVLAFRGTQVGGAGASLDRWWESYRAIENLAIDADGARTIEESGIDPGTKVGVHAGFSAALGQLMNTAGLRNELDAIATRGDSVTFTGHSLGAALATLVAFRSIRDLPALKIDKVVVIESPRVGDDAFARQWAKHGLGARTLRIAIGTDIVTHVGPKKSDPRAIGLLRDKLVPQLLAEALQADNPVFAVFAHLAARLARGTIEGLPYYEHVDGREYWLTPARGATGAALDLTAGWANTPGYSKGTQWLDAAYCRFGLSPGQSDFTEKDRIDRRVTKALTYSAAQEHLAYVDALTAIEQLENDGVDSRLNRKSDLTKYVDEVCATQCGPGEILDSKTGRCEQRCSGDRQQDRDCSPSPDGGPNGRSPYCDRAAGLTYNSKTKTCVCDPVKGMTAREDGACICAPHRPFIRADGRCHKCPEGVTGPECLPRGVIITVTHQSRRDNGGPPREGEIVSDVSGGGQLTEYPFYTGYTISHSCAGHRPYEQPWCPFVGPVHSQAQLVTPSWRVFIKELGFDIFQQAVGPGHFHEFTDRGEIEVTTTVTCMGEGRTMKDARASCGLPPEE